MKNDRFKKQEDLLIDIINANVEQPNLSYSSLRAKINIEIKEPKKQKLFPNYISKLIITCSLALIIMFTIIGITTIDKYSILYQDSAISNALLDTTNTFKKRNNEYEGISVFNLLLNKDENSSYYLEAELLDNDSDYYCLYLDKRIINKVNQYFLENDIEESTEYINFIERIDYQGIDDLFVKYSYYRKLKKLSDDEMKWAKYSSPNDIKNSIGKYHLVLTLFENKFDNIYDLQKKQKIETNLTVITEINLSKISDIKLMEKGRYLINVHKEFSKDLYISDTYLSLHSAFIKTFDEIDYLEGIIPQWYNVYLSDSKNQDWTLEHVIDLKNLIDEISPYKSFKQNIYEEVNCKTIYKYYYDYANMKSYLGV